MHVAAQRPARPSHHRIRNQIMPTTDPPTHATRSDPPLSSSDSALAVACGGNAKTLSPDPPASNSAPAPRTPAPRAAQFPDRQRSFRSNAHLQRLGQRLPRIVPPPQCADNSTRKNGFPFARSTAQSISFDRSAACAPAVPENNQPATPDTQPRHAQQPNVGAATQGTPPSDPPDASPAEAPDP